MGGYNVVAGFLIFFFLFVYFTWFLTSLKIEKQKEESNIKINPYDQLPLHRKLIDKKNKKVRIFDLGNHFLILGMILLAVFISLNVE